MRKSIFRKGLAIIVIALFTLTGIVPVIQSLEQKYNSLELDNKIKDRIPILKQMGPVGTYEDYINSREDKPYLIQRISESLEISNSPLVIVFVEVDLFSNLAEELTLYNDTLKIVGYNSVIYQVSGVTPEDLKDIIITYWNGGYKVTGTVLIGNLPVEWFHHENDFDGHYSEFPCDLFLMDLDGNWTDTDMDGMYDSHTDGSGDTAPEIYVGRIDASNIPGSEITILKKYFTKVYDFWSDNTNNTKYGLTYTDQDWAGYPDFRYDIEYAYEDYEAIWYPGVERDDYVNRRITGIYEFIQLSCHSSSQSHAFTIGGWAYNDEIRNAPPKALFYNLFCCSSLRFTDYNCLGYAYILDTDTPSLSVIGSTKTGSMLDFRYFYEPIGNGSSFGTAFRKWFEYEYPYSDDPSGYNNISWFYGMTILGDPTIVIKSLPPYAPSITGPMSGEVKIEYEYTFNATDPNGNDEYYYIEWGDGSTEEWIGPYGSGEEVKKGHIWDKKGNYTIRAKAKDFRDLKSGWSEPLIVRISNPPDVPIIDGPNSGKPRVEYTFCINASDPDNDTLFVLWDWGDGTSIDWLGPYISGQEVCDSHSWNETGTYNLSVKVRDEYGASVTAYKEITIPRNRATSYLWYHWFFERFTLLERLLTLIRTV